MSSMRAQTQGVKERNKCCRGTAIGVCRPATVATLPTRTQDAGTNDGAQPTKNVNPSPDFRASRADWFIITSLVLRHHDSKLFDK